MDEVVLKEFDSLHIFTILLVRTAPRLVLTTSLRLVGIPLDEPFIHLHLQDKRLQMLAKRTPYESPLILLVPLHIVNKIFNRIDYLVFKRFYFIVILETYVMLKRVNRSWLVLINYLLASFLFIFYHRKILDFVETNCEHILASLLGYRRVLIRTLASEIKLKLHGLFPLIPKLAGCCC